MKAKKTVDIIIVDPKIWTMV